jgi:cell division protein FtsB
MTAVAEDDLDLDRRVTARVENLARLYRTNIHFLLLSFMLDCDLSECRLRSAELRLTMRMAVLPPLPVKYKGWLAVCAAALLLFIVSTVFGDRGLVQLMRLQSEQRQLERVAFDLQQRNQKLRLRIDRLVSDDRYIERLARERLGLAKKDELIYRIPAAETSK